jgi:hypothetical protein
MLLVRGFEIFFFSLLSNEIQSREFGSRYMSIQDMVVSVGVRERRNGAVFVSGDFFNVSVRQHKQRHIFGYLKANFLDRVRDMFKMKWAYWNIGLFVR